MNIKEKLNLCALDIKDTMKLKEVTIKSFYDTYKVCLSFEDTSKDNGVVLNQNIEVGKVIDEGTTVTITVNKLAETKTVPIKVNVKSLLDGNIYETSNAENTTEKVVKNVKLEVKVGNDTIYSQTVKASETAISAGNAKGTGTTTVKVYIDGVLKNDGGYTLVYSNVNSYTAE